MRRKLIIVLFTGLGTFLFCSCQNSPTKPTPSSPAFYLTVPFASVTWGGPVSGSGPGQFQYPTDVAFDKNGNVYVMDAGNLRVQKFDFKGNYLLKWGVPAGWGIAVDGNGFVYLAGNTTNQIYKYNSNSNPVTLVTQWGGSGSANGQFNNPKGIGVDGNNNVFISESTGNGSGIGQRIQKFDSTGNFILKWGSVGSGNGNFNSPAQIAIDNNGNIYVVDNGNKRVQKFDLYGNYVTQWSNNQFVNPSGIALDGNGNVYVVDYTADQVEKFDSNGNWILQWGGFGSGLGQYYAPVFARVDSRNNVYVADEYNHRIEITNYPYSLVGLNVFGVFPNPVKSGQKANFEFSLKGPRVYSVVIKDYQSNVINQYQGQGVNGNNILEWNMTDFNGQVIGTGDYLAIFNSGSTAVTQKLTYVQ